MKLALIFNDLQPFSINSTYYGGSGRFVKTSAAREWCAQFFHRLAAYESQLAEMRACFDPLKHGYSLTMSAYYPADKFITKKGGVSAKTMDLSNCEKSLVDCLFLPKFFNEPSPYGAQNLNCDDKHLVALHSFKRQTSEAQHRIELEIEIVPL